MLIDESELKERMESPLNLLNRLRILTTPNKHNIIPSLPPTSTDIMPDIDDKLEKKSTSAKATKVMDLALAALENRIPEVHKARELAAIASDMGKIISGEKERGGDAPKLAQIIIYAPQMVQEEQFDVIDIGDN